MAAEAGAQVFWLPWVLALRVGWVHVLWFGCEWRCSTIELVEDDFGEFVVDVVDFLEVEHEHDAQFLA